MIFKSNKKKSNASNSVVNNHFTNELIVNEDNQIKDYTIWNRVISTIDGMDRSMFSIANAQNNVNVVIPALNICSDIVDGYHNDSYYKSEIKQICNSRTDLDYNNFVKDIKTKQIRKSIISGVTDFVLPTLVNKLIEPKLNKNKVGKVIYYLNIPSLVGIVSGSAIDTAINKSELKQYLDKDDQLKISSTSYYLGEYKYANGQNSNFTTRNMNNTKNKIVGAVCGSIFSEAIGLIMDKCTKHDEEEIVKS